jgi:PKD repeat protein
VSSNSEAFGINNIPVVYQWDFGDGTPHSNEANPEHIYTKTGQFTWKMTAAKGEETCQKTGIIHVLPKNLIAFTYPRQGDNLEPGSYQTITWNETGDQDAQVRLQLLRKDTLVQTLAAGTENDGAFTWQVPVNLEPAADYVFRIEALTTQYLVDSEPVSITAKKITYKWDFGDGNSSTEANPVHIYATPDTYHWTLDTTMDGKTCQKKGSVTIQDAPTITFSYPQKGNNLEPGSYQTITWDKTGFQDAQVRIKLMRNDAVVLNLSSSTENDGSFTWQVPINLESATDYKFRIEALYMPLHGESDPVSITAKEITYKWNFGDGNTSNQANPIHIYATPDTYHWTLDTTMDGKTCRKKGSVTIKDAPTIIFSYPQKGNNLEPGSYQTITWNKTGFQDAQVRIKLMRNDAVVLNLSSSTENDGSFTWQVPINLESATDYKFRIEALYMPLHGESDPVSITAKEITYKWDFGDGTQATGPNPKHIYEKPGTYHWTLDTTMDGKTCRKKGSVTIKDAPTITFTYPSAGNNLEPGSYQTVTWNKTGSQDARVRIKLMRNDAVVLNLSSSTENSGNFTWQVPINLESAADYKFRVETLYMPLHGESDPVSITAKGITYKWDFGDGSRSTEANPVHIYEKPGEYHWTLETTMDGLTCQKKGTVKAGPAPTITFSYPQAGHNLEPGSYQTITWNKTGFQDAQVRIKLMRSDALVQTLSTSTGNDGAFTWQVPINLEPAEDYIFRVETLYMPVHGDSKPVSIVAKPITYKWDFGDNTQATGPNPTHIYKKPGIYHWKMEAEIDGITCTSTGAVVFPGQYIMITNPKQGDNLPIGSLCTVTWIKSEIPDATVKIDLLKNGAKVLAISPQTENDGSFDWTVPASLEPGTDYAIFMETTDTHINRIGFRFSISKPTVPAAERAALIALYNSTNGDNWTDNGGWKTPPLHTDGFALPGTENTWHGVTCNTNNTTVESINLRSNKLAGQIPPQLGNLTNLNDLNLGINQLTGGIPTGLGNLTKLRTLHLGNNPLGGSIPPELGKLTNLENFQAGNCKLTGNIPGELGNLTNLQVLFLRPNQLTGSIPKTIGNLTKLTELNISQNQLSGTIPPELENLVELQYLNLGRNKQLSGDIPTGLGKLVKLQTLFINACQLTGTIPRELGNLANLEQFSLSENMLTGTIPTELCNLKNLSSFYLDGNQLTGNIPPELANLVNLAYLQLAKNRLTGSIPPELGNLKKLRYLILSDNRLTGTIPVEIGSLTALQILGLRHNQLTGSIPPVLGNLTELRQLSLYENQLSGSIPPELGNLKKLDYLYLRNNRLTGIIPPELGNLTNLKGLLLDKNHLSGSIPPELGNLVNVTQLWIDGNQLKGEIPTGLTNLVKMSYISTCTNIGYNALYTDDNTLRLFLNKKDPGWDTAQTIAPSEVSAEVLTDSSIKVAWTPIPYTANEGGYRVFYGKTAGGPYTFYKTTADKTVSSMTIDGLSPGTAYYIVVQTRTEPNENNNNIVDSEYSKEVSAPTTSAVIIPNDPDFNNDGKVDILWRNNATGENMVWFMDGIHKIAGENLETKDNLKWKIVGTGDFNGDGKVDILWRNFTNGKNRVWFMDGITKTGAKGLEMWTNMRWRIVGTGDFNEDGKVDILWRNFTNGKNRVWFMDGITKTGAKGLEMWDNMKWRIVGTGDFNEDGKVDILWRNFTNGKNRVWFMDGITKTGAKGLEKWDNLKWEIVSTGDFNGDNKVDILWRNYTNGKNRVWFMDGVTKTGAKGLDILPDTHWKVFDSGD